jgi:hypothetical protein
LKKIFSDAKLSIYFCRRWEGNSDASLDIAGQNANNTCKDRIRTWELEAGFGKIKG